MGGGSIALVLRQDISVVVIGKDYCQTVQTVVAKK